MRGSIAAAAACVVLLAGCTSGGAEPTETEPEATARTSGTSPESTEPTSVEAADGELVEMEHLSFHLPGGWEVGEQATSTVIAKPTRFADPRMFTVSVFPTSNTQNEVLANQLEGLRDNGRVRRLPPLELPGCTAYQTAMFDRQLDTFRYDAGCVTGLKLYSFWCTDPKGDLGRARELADPIFASLQMG